MSFKKLELWRLEKAAAQNVPTFIIVHSTDLAETINNTVRKWSTVVDFQNWAKEHVAVQPAFLYISEGSTGFYGFENAKNAKCRIDNPDTNDGWISEAGNVTGSDTAFCRRLEAMLRAWEESGCKGAPDWSLLKYDWLKNALDYATAASLLLSRDMDNVKEQLLQEKDVDPFGREYDRGVKGVILTKDDQKHLNILKEVLGLCVDGNGGTEIRKEARTDMIAEGIKVLRSIGGN